MELPRPNIVPEHHRPRHLGEALARARRAAAAGRRIADRLRRSAEPERQERRIMRIFRRPDDDRQAQPRVDGRVQGGIGAG